MIMHWPQITEIILLTIGTVVHGMKHGQPRTDKYNIGTQFLGLAIVIALLYFGGFWTGGQPCQ